MPSIRHTQFAQYFRTPPAENVIVLTRSEAQFRYAKIFGERFMHPFQFPASHWILSARTRQLLNWRTCYNAKNYYKYSLHLADALPWGGKDVVNFLINSENVIELPWGEFVQNWDGFLAIEDDYVFVAPWDEMIECTLACASMLRFLANGGTDVITTEAAGAPQDS